MQRDVEDDFVLPPIEDDMHESGLTTRDDEASGKRREQEQADRGFRVEGEASPFETGSVTQLIDEAMEKHRKELEIHTRLLKEILIELKCRSVAHSEEAAWQSNDLGDSPLTDGVTRMAEMVDNTFASTARALGFTKMFRGSNSDMALGDSEAAPAVGARQSVNSAVEIEDSVIASRRVSFEAAQKRRGCWAARCVKSKAFENATGVLIFVNAILIGVHANRRVERPGVCEDAWVDMSLIFNVVFLLELLLRVIVDQKQFCVGPDARWNVFDTVVVLGGFIDDFVSRQSMSNCTGDATVAPGDTPHDNFTSGITILRILRVIRLVRTLKAFRTMTIFRDLRIMVTSTMHSIIPLLWACLLLGFIFWCFSIYLMHLVADQVSFLLIQQGPAALEAPEVVEARRWFGSFFKSIHTLFMCITGGIDWDTPCNALEMLTGDGLITAFFMAFIALTMFAALNVITGVFVENAMKVALKDKDLAIEATLKDEKKYVDDVAAVFLEADTDFNGQLTLAEFEDHVGDKRVQAFMENLSLDFRDAQRMFTLLDTDCNGALSLDEFVNGCMHFRGEAKTLDIMAVLGEVTKLSAKFTTAITRVERQREKRMERLSTLLLVPSRGPSRSNSNVRISM